MHCLPPRTLEPLDKNGISQAQREQKKNCIIGNAFRLASVMVFFIIVLSAIQPTEGTIARLGARAEFDENTTVAERVRGSVFSMDTLDRMQGMLTPEEIAEDIAEQFAPRMMDKDALNYFKKNSQKRDALRLQTYWAWPEQKRTSRMDDGPDWRSQRQRAAILPG